MTAGDIIQAVFFIVTGVLAVLTYWQAKRTLFQPHRAEVYSRQLDKLDELNGLLDGDSSELLELGAGLVDTLVLSAAQLIREYGKW